MQQGRIVADGTASQIKKLASGRTVRATLADADHASARRRSPGSTRSRCAATPCSCTPRLRRGRALPAHADRRARPRDHRAATSSRRSSASPETTDDRPPPPSDTTTMTARRALTAADHAGASRRLWRVQHDDPRHRTAAGDAQQALDHLHAVDAAAVLRVRRPAATGRQAAGHGNITAYILISMAAYGAMITAAAGGASLDRARRWLEPPAAAHAPAPGLLHLAQGHRRHGIRRSRDQCRTSSARRSGADDAAGHAGSPAPCCAALHDHVRGPRPVHGLPAAEPERHADPRSRPGGDGLPRRVVRPARLDGSTLFATSRTSRRCTASARSRTRRSPVTWRGRGRQRGGLDRAVRCRRRLAVPPRHRAGLSRT